MWLRVADAYAIRSASWAIRPAWVRFAQPGVQQHEEHRDRHIHGDAVPSQPFLRHAEHATSAVPMAAEAYAVQNLETC